MNKNKDHSKGVFFYGVLCEVHAYTVAISNIHNDQISKELSPLALQALGNSTFST
jgi:hypothetical protein